MGNSAVSLEFFLFFLFTVCGSLITHQLVSYQLSNVPYPVFLSVSPVSNHIILFH